MGYKPRVILAGRGINNEVGAHVAQRTVKLLSKANVPLRNARIAILGLTFKENVPDLRNTRVCDIVAELEEFGISPMVHDPMGDPAEALAEYGIRLCSWEDIRGLDAMIYAVPHRFYTDQPMETLLGRIRDGGVLVDVKSAIPPKSVPASITYWSL